jgi:hypothetical protein
VSLCASDSKDIYLKVIKVNASQKIICYLLNFISLIQWENAADVFFKMV